MAYIVPMHVKPKFTYLIGSDNGLSPIQHQAHGGHFVLGEMSSTNEDAIHWCMYATRPRSANAFPGEMNEL